jgi:hypothetical protein
MSTSGPVNILVEPPESSGTISDELKNDLAPQLTGDLSTYFDALGSMFTQVEVYTLDDPTGDGTGGWCILLDVDRTPYPYGTAYLAQWVGESLPAGISEVEARAWIVDGPNQRRGTPVSIARAAQRTLTGDRLVQLLERTKSDGTVDPNGDNFTVVTYTDQTPDPAQVWQDLLTVIPADMVCNYETEVGPKWLDIHQTYATWNAVKAAFPTWGAVRGFRPGSSQWDRPGMTTPSG